MNREQRIEQELQLLRGRHPQLEVRGRWACIRGYPLPDGWNCTATDVAFEIPRGYPSREPYMFFVPEGLRYEGRKPANYNEPANKRPPFDGLWGGFSWRPGENWQPREPISAGSNLVNWVQGIACRFREGR